MTLRTKEINVLLIDEDKKRCRQTERGKRGICSNRRVVEMVGGFGQGMGRLADSINRRQVSLRHRYYL